MSTISTQLFATTGFASAEINLHAFKGYLFMCGYNLNTLYRISLDNSSSLTALFTSSDGLDGLGNDGTYLYITNQTNGVIKRYDISGVQDTTWTVSSSKGWGLTIYQNYIYTSDYQNGKISQISIANKTVNNNFITGLPTNGPNGINILNNNMYVCINKGSNSIYKIPINFSNNPPTAGTATTFISGLDYPYNILSYNDTFYVSFFTNQIIQYDLSGNVIRTISSGTSSKCYGLTIATINKNIYLFNANTNIYSLFLDTVPLPPPFFSGQITCTNMKYVH